MAAFQACLPSVFRVSGAHENDRREEAGYTEEVGGGVRHRRVLPAASGLARPLRRTGPRARAARPPAPALRPPELAPLKGSVAESVTAEFFQRHPDWLDRYGDRGIEHGIQDAQLHIGFLAGALSGGDPEAFGEYVAWTRRVLEARGISAPFLRENLEQIEAALLLALPAEDHESLRAALQAGYRARDAPSAAGRG